MYKTALHTGKHKPRLRKKTPKQSTKIGKIHAEILEYIGGRRRMEAWRSIKKLRTANKGNASVKTTL
jgi:hypothetical protein